MKKEIKTTLLLLFINLFFIHSAEANYPIYQISYLVNFPSTAVFQTMGIALLVIVLIEALVLKKIEKLSFIKAFYYAFLANIFSTVLGAVSYPGSSVMMILPMIVIGSVFLTKMVKAIALHGEYKKRPASLLIYFTFLGLGLITMKLISLTIPGGRGLLRADRIYFVNNLEVFIAVISAFGLLAMGYLISVVSEGYIFTKLFPKGQRFVRTLLKINLLSYLALIMILSPNILTVIQEKSWWFHSKARYNLSGHLKKEATPLVLYESINGEWETVVQSSINTLTNLGYEIKMIWPKDKSQKFLKEIDTTFTSLDEAKRAMNFPTSIQLEIRRDNEQTTNMKIEIVLEGYETDDGYLPELGKHQDSGCLTGPIKEALIKSFAQNNFSENDLKCTTGRWTKSK
ncbi:MAG: hypothetical protein NUV91_04550 [Candidatus Omnitrophica bacterium]|nr:hypothetical protein [Candidatus Omnitrophota bacterium]